MCLKYHDEAKYLRFVSRNGTRTRTNTNPNGTEANAAGRTGNARALRKQSKCGVIQEGEGHWPNSSKNLQKARNLWVLRTPQNKNHRVTLSFLPLLDVAGLCRNPIGLEY